MRYLGLLGLLIAVAIMLYLSAPKTTEQATRTTTYNAATRAAQHATGAAEQRVRDIMKPPVDDTNANP
jgi:hypothetical protein